MEYIVHCLPTVDTRFSTARSPVEFRNATVFAVQFELVWSIGGAQVQKQIILRVKHFKKIF